LWVRQVGTLNDAQIIPPLEARFLGLTFSPDGSYVFFVTYEKAKNEGVLYRIPVIGGSPQRVLNDIDSPVTFSPDGKQIAFVRGYPVLHETWLLIANADGTNERRLVSRVFPAFLSSEGPAWSPNGLLIACGVRTPEPRGISETVLGVEPISGKEERLTEQRWFEVGRISWNKGGELIILNAAQDQGLHQLWQISLPGGLAHRITNDLTNYQGVSLTSDVSALSTVEVEANSSIWITNGPQPKAN
jgi:dipeptidyl aminopeptidase/acylaminoacyl peptidase